MGVHNEAVYPEVKRLLGIPEDEPIFIIRAQDVLSADAIEGYRELYTEEVRKRAAKNQPPAELGHGLKVHLSVEQRKFRAHLMDCEDEMFDWQEKHPGSVKVPD